MAILSEEGLAGGDFSADIAAVQRIDAVPRILDIVCRLTGMGFAAVARVTEGRWICCAVRDDIAFGLRPGGELKVETTICHEIRQSHEAVAIDHVAEDTAFSGHATPAIYGFQSYISVPIVLADGSFFGTLCAIDPRPARLNNPETLGTLKLFAELIATHLATLDRLNASEALLMSERQTADLREQFIAVLGHDLRNPLAAIASGIELLKRAKSLEDTGRTVKLMQRSINRMLRLIDDVLDFARGRLGGGLILQRTPNEPIEGVLTQVAAEIRAAHPDQTIETQFDVAAPIHCDPQRIGQLFSNLLGNAASHGAPDKPVVARATAEDGMFELSVANAGDSIPPETLDRLFQPFYRGADDRSTGLGLGLFIAAEIARSHGGTLKATSAEGQTRFTFRMPAG